MKMTLKVLFAGLVAVPLAAYGQESGMLATQVLVRAESKLEIAPDVAAISLKVEDKAARLTSFKPVQPGATQIALLIDDGLSRSAATQLNDLQSFIRALPAGTEVLIGYMTDGRVNTLQPFTTDHAAAAEKVRVPFGVPGQSASPYFCLSDFVKHWPESGGKARFVMMVTNGVDPYNGSTSLFNQDSPYVQTAVEDAQRAGAAVYSIYYRDAGFNGGLQNSVSGQGYLEQVAEGTGGLSFYEGTGSPVALKPFLADFSRAVAESYIATFDAQATGGGRSHLVRVKMNTSTPKLKLRAPSAVRPGNMETPGS